MATSQRDGDVLVVDIDEEWVYGIELGESHVGKYKPHVLKAIV